MSGSNENNGLTKASLCEALSEALPSLTHRKSSELFASIVDIVKESLANGQEVKIYGFGKFSLREKKQRNGRNPATGEPVVIPAKRVLRFQPSSTLRKSLNAV